MHWPVTIKTHTAQNVHEPDSRLGAAKSHFHSCISCEGRLWLSALPYTSPLRRLLLQRGCHATCSGSPGWFHCAWPHLIEIAFRWCKKLFACGSRLSWGSPHLASGCRCWRWSHHLLDNLIENTDTKAHGFTSALDESASSSPAWTNGVSAGSIVTLRKKMGLTSTEGSTK